MAEIDKTGDSDFTLCWARGDDDPRIFTIKDSAGSVVDISTWTLRMAVNTDSNPVDTVNEIFSIAGEFVSDGTDGQISFTPPANSLDTVEAPGVAFYDVNRVTPSIKTLLKGQVLFIQDIDKG